MADCAIECCDSSVLSESETTASNYVTSLEVFSSIFGRSPAFILSLTKPRLAMLDAGSEKVDF